MERLQRRALSNSISRFTWLAVAILATANQAGLLAQKAPLTTHQLEFYLPFYEFFDGTKVKWVYQPDKKGDAYGRGYRYTLGFVKRHFLTYSSSKFGATYFVTKGKVPPGEIMHRFFKLETLDYHYRWLNRERLHMDAFVGVTKRWGWEDFVVAYPQWWEILSHNFDTRDLGIHTGMRAEYTFWKKRVFASMQLSYTHYFARPEVLPRPSVIKTGPNMNVLALDMGIGYTLPRIHFKRQPGRRLIEF